MLLRCALPAAHFHRNATIPVTDLVHEKKLKAFSSKSAAFSSPFEDVVVMLKLCAVSLEENCCNAPRLHGFA
jgi:hypothetical protein